MSTLRLAVKLIDLQIPKQATVNSRSGHIDLETFICLTCGDKFSSALELHEHQETHNRTSVQLPEVLDEPMDTAFGMMATGEKPFECQFCNQKFTCKSGLKVHERSHTGEKPFLCPFCKRKFTCKSHLKVHERSHTGEKPFECRFCNQRFSRTDVLKVHERCHTGEKPFLCTLCKQGFSQTSHLKRHKRSHTGS